MPDWNETIHKTVENAEAELKEVIQHLNDNVVPDIRKNGASALQAAAEQLRRLAAKLDGRE